MNIKQTIAIGMVALLIISGISAAQTLVYDDFEGANNWTNDMTIVESTDAPRGDHFGRNTDSDFSDPTLDVMDGTQPDVFSFWIRGQDSGRYEFEAKNSNGDNTIATRIDGGTIYYYDINTGLTSTGINVDQQGTWYGLEYDMNWGDNTGTLTVYDINGNVVGTASVTQAGGNTIGQFESSVNAHDLDQIQGSGIAFTETVSGTVTDSNGNPLDNATVSTNTGISTTTESDGSFSFEAEDGNYDVTANKQNYNPQTKNIDVSGGPVTVDFSLEEIPSALSIEGPNFVRPNEAIPYSVEYTNASGTYVVTEYSNVTSANSTLLTVNEINNTLDAGSHNTTVVISAEYETNEVSVNTTRTYYVSYLKLSNIDTVPPSKWIQAFLGFDDGYAEGQNMQGIGSDIQWLLFMIIVMSVIGKTFDNPWAGIGSGVITGVLLWVLEYIGLGLLLSTVFFGIFIGLILVRVRRDGGNQVTINEN